MNKKFWATTFTLTGTIIGAGIWGIPYVLAKSGYLLGVFWIIAICSLMAFVNLCLAEVTLRTKEVHQLPGYARKYLGRKGEVITFFAMVFGMYSALLAYLVGEGQSLSSLLPGNINPIIWGILFWTVMTFLLRGGMKGLKRVETYGVLTIIIIILGVFIFYLPQTNPANISVTGGNSPFLPIGVILFSFLGFSSIPELRREIAGEEKKLKKAVILGFAIPMILYILFSFIFIGLFGENIPEVANLAFGSKTTEGITMTILGIVTMMTSFFVLSFSLRDIYKYDLKLSHQNTFLFASLLPLLIYILIEIFGMASFSQILSIGGTISGGLTGILILIMARSAKKSTRNGKSPEIKIPLNWPLIIIISLIFIVGIIFEFI